MRSLTGLGAVLQASDAARTPKFTRRYSGELSDLGVMEQLPSAVFVRIAAAVERIPYRDLPSTVVMLTEDAGDFAVELYDREVLAQAMKADDLCDIAHELRGSLVMPGHLQLLWLFEGRILRATPRAELLATVGKLAAKGRFP
jgi:hypothetical protein